MASALHTAGICTTSTHVHVRSYVFHSLSVLYYMYAVFIMHCSVYVYMYMYMCLDSTVESTQRMRLYMYCISCTLHCAGARLSLVPRPST